MKMTLQYQGKSIAFESDAPPFADKRVADAVQIVLDGNERKAAQLFIESGYPNGFIASVTINGVKETLRVAIDNRAILQIIKV
jgi:hypothetical protein